MAPSDAPSAPPPGRDDTPAPGRDELPLPSLRAAVARVTCEGGIRGTAFLIDPQHALTALHVVGDRRARPIVFYGSVQLDFDGHLTAATVVAGACDADADWALLRLQAPPCDAAGRPVAPLPLDDLGEDELQLAEHAGRRLAFRSRGFPDANPEDGLDVGGEVRTTLGQVSGVRALQLYSSEAAAGTGAPVSGLSGAPVWVAGAVVGLLRTAILDGEGRSMAGALFACPAGTVLAALGLRGGPALQLKSLGCPYPGMVAFARHQSSLFFGRSAEIDWLQLHLRKQRFALVLGPSGSGKSSLIYAGLLPRLGPDQVVRTMRPGDQPERELAVQLGGEGAPLLTTLGPEQRLVLFIDQLEELFVRCPRPTQSRFLLRLQALRDDSKVTLLLALRADFFPDLMSSALWPIDPAQRLEVAPLRGAALASAIAGPAAQVGVRLEPTLLERLVADAAEEPGALPLLQETLVLLWEHRENRRLTLAAYEQLGQPTVASAELAGGDSSDTAVRRDGTPRSGLAIAIASHAEAVFAMMAKAPQQQALARRIFVRLVHFGEGRPNTRRQLPRSALRAQGDEPEVFAATLELLASQRLITQTSDENAPASAGEDAVRVDLSHEIILRAWPRLLRWIGEKKQAERIRRRLEDQASERQRLRQQGYGLLDGAEVKEAEDWLAGPDARDLGISAAVAELIRDSRRALDWEAAHAKRQTRRWQAAALFMLLIACFAAGAAALAVFESRRAHEQAELATKSKNLAAAQARTATGRSLSALSRQRLSTAYDQALLLAVAGQRLSDSAETDASLLAALLQAPGLLKQIHGHDGQVRSVAVSPDGRLLATGCSDGRVRLFDPRDGRPLGELPHGAAGLVTQVAFTADSARLISAGTDGALQVFDVLAKASGTRAQPLGQPLRGHRGEVTALAVSPDGKLFASGGGDDMTVLLWDAVTGLAVGPPLLGHRGTVTALAFSPDGRQLASVSLDKSLHLWAPRSGQPLPLPPVLQKFNYPLRAVAWSPVGGLLAVGGGDGGDAGVQLFSLDAAGATKKTLHSTAKIVSSLAFSPDGLQLAAGMWDKQAELFDVRSGKRAAPLRSPGGPVLGLSYAPDGNWLVTATEYSGLYLWSPRPVAALQVAGTSTADKLTSVSVSPDGRALAAGSLNSPVHLFALDGENGQGVRETATLSGHTGAVSAVAYSPDRKRLASVGADQLVHLWSVPEGKPQGAPLAGHRAPINTVVFDASGARLATGSFDGEIRLWSADSGTLQGMPLRGHTQAVWGLGWSRDGTRLCSASQDMSLRIWDTRTGGELATVSKSHTQAVTACVFSPTSPHVVSASEDGTLRIWTLGDAELQTTVPATDSPAQASVAGVLAVRPIGRPLRGHTGKIRQLAITGNGQRILSVGDDHVLRLWDLPTQTLVGTLGDTGSSLAGVALASGDRLAATVSEDGSVRLWDLDVNSWVEQACQRAGRDLGQRERSLFLGGDNGIGEDALGPVCPTAQPATR